ncbi:MAG: hypothetical protein Q9M50_03735 [Methylococcales bacterium]|nr:hypothetical protein [Methylococcales bacterium]
MKQIEGENEIKAIFSEDLFQQEVEIDSSIWDAGFDVNRQLIVSKLGFYEKIFLRPEKYVKRFYHRCHPILIEDWEISEQLQLYDGFCSMGIKLEIRFQATLDYIEKHRNFIIEINQQIKAAYEAQLLSVVRSELNALTDGSWLKNGLGSIEKKIGLLISETLILHHIQAQALCSLKPHFKEFPHIELTKENINISLAKKEFDMENQKQQEVYRQEIETDTKKYRHNQQRLKQLDYELDIERRKLALEAEHERLILVEKEGMQIDYFAIEERLSTDKIAHENRLKEIILEADFNQQQAQRKADHRELIESLSYRHQLGEKQLHADIVRYEQQQKQWLEAKERVHSKKIEAVKKRKKL